MKRLLAVLILMLPTIASAQQQTTGIEITPFFGYRGGGDFQAQAINPNGDVTIADSVSYGLTVDFPLNPYMQLELMANFQNSNFEKSGEIFDPNVNLGDVSVDYYHVGILVQSGNPKVQGFGVFSLGATQLNPDLAGVKNETRFSSSFGGGVKFYLSPNVGIRLEGRGYYTLLDSNNNDSCYYCYSYNNDLWQAEVNAGLIVKF